MHHYYNIVHLGVGNFFRAHQAAYVNSVNQQQAKLYKANPHYSPSFYNIHGYVFHNQTLAHDLNSQNGNYLLTTRDNAHSTSVVITAIAHVYTKSELIQFLNVIANPHTKMITLTVTERGYQFNNDLFKPLIFDNNGKIDSTNDFNSNYFDCKSIYSLLYYGLKLRFLKYAQNKDPNSLYNRYFTMPDIDIISCDNIVENTHILKKRLIEFTHSDKQFLADLIKYAFFRISIVDRITPVTTMELKNSCKQCLRPVQAEYYTSWYIESMPKDKNELNPLFERLKEQGVIFTNEVESLSMNKIRILNGGHICLAYYAKIKGYSKVFEAMEDSDVFNYVKEYMEQTAAVLKKLLKNNFDYEQYISSTLDRFLNRHIVDYVDRLVVKAPVRLQGRILPLIKEYNQAGANTDILYQIHANYIICLHGETIYGEKFEKFEKNNKVFEHGVQLYNSITNGGYNEKNEKTVLELCRQFLQELYINERDMHFLNDVSIGLVNILKFLKQKYKNAKKIRIAKL